MLFCHRIPFIFMLKFFVAAINSFFCIIYGVFQLFRTENLFHYYHKYLGKFPQNQLSTIDKTVPNPTFLWKIFLQLCRAAPTSDRPSCQTTTTTDRMEATRPRILPRTTIILQTMLTTKTTTIMKLEPTTVMTATKDKTMRHLEAWWKSSKNSSPPGLRTVGENLILKLKTFAELLSLVLWLTIFAGVLHMKLAQKPGEETVYKFNVNELRQLAKTAHQVDTKRRWKGQHGFLYSIFNIL